jgi:hypothetical protein
MPTDVLAICAVRDPRRLALHIEHKRATAAFTDDSIEF